MTQLAIGTLGIIVFYFAVLFAIACQKRKFAIADSGWGLGFVITAIYCDISGTNNTFLPTLVTILVTIWGLRLSIYIHWRNRHKPEDFRYAKLRSRWIRFANVHTFFKIYLPQAIIMWIISTAIMISAVTPAKNINIFTWIFTATAIFGICYEAIADYQLSRFKADPLNKGKVLMSGLWRYSRHPNYFGEIVFWWSLSLIVALSTMNYAALISGAILNLVIVYVSGIVLIEDHFSHDPVYENYMKNTNTVIPGKPDSN